MTPVKKTKTKTKTTLKNGEETVSPRRDQETPPEPENRRHPSPKLSSSVLH